MVRSAILDCQLQSWYRAQMMCGYYFYRYSVLNPAFLRALASLIHSSLQSRPFHVNSHFLPFLQQFPHHALGAFNLQYRQISYLSGILPYHHLYLQVAHLLNRILNCTPRDFFQRVMGMDLDSLHTTLSAFLTDLSPLFKAYTAYFLNNKPISRSVLVYQIAHYPILYQGSLHQFNHDLMMPLLHVTHVNEEIQKTRIFLNTRSAIHYQNSMTIPFEDRILMIVHPYAIRNHTDVLQRTMIFAHELGHALQSTNLIANHHSLYQMDYNHPEIWAILFENFYTSPSLMQQKTISSELAHQIAFYTHYRILLRCIKEAGQALTLVNCLRFPRLTRSAFHHITNDYFRTMTHVLGYPVIHPPRLNSYSFFYDLESVLGHWITGIQTIEHYSKFGEPISVFLDYRPFVQKKWQFLHLLV